MRTKLETTEHGSEFFQILLGICIRTDRRGVVVVVAGCDAMRYTAVESAFDGKVRCELLNE
jgi:hypothetical protein